ncbi:hypothetical protein [Neisseria sp. P0013.S004]|uniref:hypothetical protein n=1 Tax=Neisseria sp. P0013.S004 TaxID=3436740 RepID=UPI003F8185B0
MSWSGVGDVFLVGDGEGLFVVCLGVGVWLFGVVVGLGVFFLWVVLFFGVFGVGFCVVGRLLFGGLWFGGGLWVFVLVGSDGLVSLVVLRLFMNTMV